MKPIRIVLDTNVYIAAAFNPQSVICRIVEDSAAQYMALYYTSPEILIELQNKLENKFNFSREKAVQWVSSLEKSIKVVRPRISLKVVERDPDDNKILECAVEAGADLIISADKDLLSLKEYNNIKIIHPTTAKYIFPKLNIN